MEKNPRNEPPDHAASTIFDNSSDSRVGNALWERLLDARNRLVAPGRGSVVLRNRILERSAPFSFSTEELELLIEQFEAVLTETQDHEEDLGTYFGPTKIGERIGRARLEVLLRKLRAADRDSPMAPAVSQPAPTWAETDWAAAWLADAGLAAPLQQPHQLLAVSLDEARFLTMAASQYVNGCFDLYRFDPVAKAGGVWLIVLDKLKFGTLAALDNKIATVTCWVGPDEHQLLCDSLKAALGAPMRSPGRCALRDCAYGRLWGKAVDDIARSLLSRLRSDAQASETAAPTEPASIVPPWPKNIAPFFRFVHGPVILTNRVVARAWIRYEGDDTAMGVQEWRDGDWCDVEQGPGWRDVLAENPAPAAALAEIGIPAEQ